MLSPTDDRGVLECYAYYPPCCDISSTPKFDGRNQLLAANTEFLKDRQTAVSLLKAYVEAENYYVQNRDKAIEVIVQFTGVGRDVVAEALKHATMEHRVDVDTAVADAQGRPEVWLNPSGMSEKMP